MNVLPNWVWGKNWWADIQAGFTLIESLFTVSEIQPHLDPQRMMWEQFVKKE